ncbi:MAG: ribonuclease III [Lachnospiraceae bacterium]|nr:ribonuclease III [Lachnospiraceae bacterium]
MEESLKGLFDPNEIDVRTYSPLTLAFLGDAVFELMVRTLVVTKGNTAPEKLHKRTTRLVKAEAQAMMGHGIWEELTEEEQSVYRRGRNAQSYTHAKNATVSDYRHATGLESLFGYLYLCGRQERMLELMKRCVEIVEEEL